MVRDMTYVGSSARDIGQSTLGTDADEGLLHVLGGDVGDGVSGVLGGLEGDHVGEKTSNMRRSHGGAGNSVDGILAANPGGLDVQTGAEDVDALADIGEVGTFIGESRGTDSDGVGGSGARVVASVGVVVASGDGKVDTGIDSGVDSHVEGWGLTPTQAHVGSRALEALLLSGLGSFHGGTMSLDGKLNTLYDVGHGARAIGAEDLDGVDVGLLGNTILLASDGARAVGSVAIAVLIRVTRRNRLTPVGTTLEVDVSDVGAGVNDIDIDTLTTILRVEVLVECAKGETIAVRDSGETPRGALLDGGVLVVRRLLVKSGVNLRVLFNVFNLQGSAGVGWIGNKPSPDCSQDSRRGGWQGWGRLDSHLGVSSASRRQHRQSDRHSPKSCWQCCMCA